MIKLGNFVVILLTMIVVLGFLGVGGEAFYSILDNFGVHIDRDTSELTDADLGNSALWKKVFDDNIGILILIIGTGAVIVGLFARGYDTSLVILPLVTTTAILFVSTFLSVIVLVQDLNQSWMTALISTIFIGLGAGFMWSCVDYFAGR